MFFNTIIKKNRILGDNLQYAIIKIKKEHRVVYSPHNRQHLVVLLQVD